MPPNFQPVFHGEKLKSLKTHTSRNRVSARNPISKLNDKPGFLNLTLLSHTQHKIWRRAGAWPRIWRTSLRPVISPRIPGRIWRWSPAALHRTGRRLLSSGSNHYQPPFFLRHPPWHSSRPPRYLCWPGRRSFRPRDRGRNSCTDRAYHSGRIYCTPTPGSAGTT
jgi:hypothetical protein